MTKTILSWAVIVIASVGITWAQSPLGDEFMVNSYVTGNVRNVSVTHLADGSIVAAWDNSSQDGNDRGVFGQVFSADGVPATAEFAVNSYTTSYQGRPAVSSTGSGFVVVWRSFGQDGGYDAVFGQRFGTSGAKAGPEFQVNTYTTGDQTVPDVAPIAGGGFVVVWASYGPQVPSVSGVFGQRYDSGGSEMGGEFLVSSNTAFGGSSPSVASAADGRFVVVWYNNAQDGDGLGAFGQRFDSAGQPSGAEIEINATTTGNQLLAEVSVGTAGDFVVVWQDGAGADGNLEGVFARRFDSLGVAQTSDFRVNVSTLGNQSEPDVSRGPDGTTFVVWTDEAGNDGSDYGIFGRRFDGDSVAMGGEFQVNSTAASFQYGSAISSDGQGRVAVIWKGSGAGDSSGAFGQRYHPLFADGFESGNTLAWSGSTP